MPIARCTTIRRAWWVFAIGVWGCQNPTAASKSSLSVAQFGLFFGGQIQQRLEIPLELDSTRQTQGFRLLFKRPLSISTEVEWTLDYPTARAGLRGPSNAPRAERTERATLPAGADRFEQLLTLRATDVPGIFNIRVRIDKEVVLDRPFRLTAKRLDSDD